MPLLGLVAALVLGVAIVVVTMRASASDTPRAAAGDVVDGFYQAEELDTEPVAVRLPWGELAVQVGEPRASLQDETADGFVDVLLAPEGGTFVRVDVVAGPDGGFPAASTTRKQPESSLALVAGDDRVPLTGVPNGFDVGPGTFLGTPETRWAAVAGEPTDLALHVTYDGVTQVVDLDGGDPEPGPADALASLEAGEPLVRETRCGRLRVRPPYRVPYESPCRLRVSPLLPYVHGLGYAPEGRAYLAVQVDLGGYVDLVDRRTGAGGVETDLAVVRLTGDGGQARGPLWLGTPTEAFGPPVAGGVLEVAADARRVPVRVVLGPGGSVDGRQSLVEAQPTYDTVVAVG